MIDEPQSENVPSKTKASEDKAPSHKQGFWVTIKQRCTIDPEAARKSAPKIDSDRPGQAEWVQLFILACGPGFVLGIIFCALLWHIQNAFLERMVTKPRPERF